MLAILDSRLAAKAAWVMVFLLLGFAGVQVATRDWQVERVAVDDGPGPSLSPRAEKGAAFLDLQTEWARRLQSKAERAACRAYGDGVTVSVHVDLEPRSTTRTDVEAPAYDLPPTKSETRTGWTEAQDAHVTLDPSLAPAVGVSPASPGSRLGQRSQTREFDPSVYGRRTEEYLAPPIRRLTVGLVLDGQLYAECKDERERSATTVGIVDLVKNSIGFDPERGDRISAPIVRRGAKARAASADIGETLIPAGAALSLVLLLLLWWRFVRRRPEREPVPAAPVALSPETSATRTRADADGETRRLRREIEGTIHADPERISRVLETWLKETGS